MAAIILLYVECGAVDEGS